MEYCFGIDIGGTTVKCGLFTKEGQLLDKWEIRTRHEESGAYILPDVRDAIFGKMNERNLSKEDIVGVGVGVPGPVNSKGEISEAVNLHWGYVNVPEELSKLTGMKVRAANDANVATLGEQWQGGGAGFRDMILVTLGTGVGGGIVINGQIVAGAHGCGGEIGHAHVDDNIKEPCNCGRYGCLEQVASATGIVNITKKTLSSSTLSSRLRGQKNISAKTVFDAVKEGDELAIEIAKQFGDYLGRALATFSVVVDPEIIVIGGGVSKAGQVLLDYIVEAFQRYAFPPCKDTKFALAKLGNDAGIYGAAKLVL